MPITIKKLDDYLKEIKNTGETKDLAFSVYNTICDYVNYRDVLKKTPTTSSEPIDLSEYFIPPFDELVYAIKEKVVDITSKSEDTMELGMDKYSQFLKEFLHDPISALKRQADMKVVAFKELNKYKDAGLVNSPNDYANLAKQNEFLSKEFAGEKDKFAEFMEDKKDVWVLKQEANSKWFTNFFCNGNKVITDELDKNKGGYFENLFGTTSKQYKEFSRRLGNIDRDGFEKGDLVGLRQAALSYLGHKFKDNLFGTKNYYVDEDMISDLDKTSQGRVRLCVSVLEAIGKAEEAVKEGLDPNNYEPEEEKEIPDEEMYYGAWLISQKNSNVIQNNIIDDELNNELNNAESNNKFRNMIKDDVEEKDNDSLFEIKEDDNLIKSDVINTKE